MTYRTIVLAALLPVSLLACSGNAVIEPAEKTSKRAKAFLAKCEPAPVDGEDELEEVYACLAPEDACPEASDPLTRAELGYILQKGDGCGPGRVVYDVPCGPDLNAIECCYVARVKATEGGCD